MTLSLYVYAYEVEVEAKKRKRCITLKLYNEISWVSLVCLKTAWMNKNRRCQNLAIGREKGHSIHAYTANERSYYRLRSRTGQKLTYINVSVRCQMSYLWISGVGAEQERERREPETHTSIHIHLTTYLSVKIHTKIPLSLLSRLSRSPCLLSKEESLACSRLS